MASMDYHSGDPVITVQPSNNNTLNTADPPKRKVSINTDTGHDNLAFEQNPRRKISQISNRSGAEHSEIGPTRKKSILHNSGGGPTGDNDPDHHSNVQGNGLHRKHSITDSVYSNRNGTYGHKPDPSMEQSWIYALCMRCRVQYNTPSWEPPGWQKVCPYPLCPSYRQFARLLSLLLIGILLWVTTYVILGETAAPGGQLFQLVVLTVAANFGGWLISLTTLPRLIGMLLVGILFANVGWVDLSGDFSHVTAELRKIALVLILSRAGLEMDPEAFKKVYVTILKLGLIPWTVECCVVAVMSHFLVDLPWIWAFMLGSIIAAVSPAVVVPCLFRLRTKGYGVAKGIPTLVVAVAGIDDAASVAIFGIIASIMFSADDTAYQISQAPVCVVGGLGFGIIWGLLSKYVPENGDAYLVPIRILMLFGGGLLAVFGSEKLGYEGAGPLGVVFAAFVSNQFWCKQGWDFEDNPVSTAFEIFWMIFEPILFGITGASVKIAELDGDVVSLALGILAAGVILRILATVGIAFGDRLNLKEKFFVSLSWMAKATVQAALGPVALRKLSESDNQSKEEKRYAEIVQMICIFSIILTAPLGAILISISGTKLLTKTKQPPNLEGWRRSHRPSLRDISIIEEDEHKDIEADNESQNATPVYTVTK